VAGKNNCYLSFQKDLLESLKKEKMIFREKLYTVDAGYESEEIIADIKKTAPDLIVSIGPWQTDFLSQHFKTTPVIFTMVYHIDAMDQILEKTPEMRGVYINLDMLAPFFCLKKISPHLKKIGTIYSRHFMSRIIPDLKAHAQKTGLELIAEPIDNETNLPKALESLIMNNIEAFYFLPDPILLTPSARKKIMLLSMTHDFFVFSEYTHFLEKGALVSFSINKEEIVKKTVALIKDTLFGEEQKEISRPERLLQCKEYELILNETMAQCMDLKISQVMRMNYIPYRKMKADHAISQDTFL
jgi:ABC-type uncharacterized transport system substrate-binding protein